MISDIATANEAGAPTCRLIARLGAVAGLNPQVKRVISIQDVLARDFNDQVATWGEVVKDTAVLADCM